jgi:hypothetical protein
MATAPSPPSTPDSRHLPLEERYSKLVEAYKKIKQQNGLLKQAVLQVHTLLLDVAQSLHLCDESHHHPQSHLHLFFTFDRS